MAHWRIAPAMVRGDGARGVSAWRRARKKREVRKRSTVCTVHRIVFTGRQAGDRGSAVLLRYTRCRIDARERFE